MRKKSAAAKALPTPSRMVSYIFMLINTVTWGAALIIIKPSLDVTTPYRFLLYRYILAGLLGLPFLFYYWRKLKPKLKQLLQIGSIEVLGTSVALWLLYAGLQRTSGIEAALLTSTQPLFITFVGVMLFKERLEKHESLGLLIAFIGTIVLTLVPLITTNKTVESVALLGNVMVLASMFINGFYFPLTKKYYRRIPKLFPSVISFYVGLISFSLLSFMEASFSFSELSTAIQFDLGTPSVVIASVYMAIFGSLIGYTALIKGMEGIEASEAGLFTYLQPLVYIPLGIILLNEHVHLIQLISLIVIFAGVFIAEKRFAHPPAEKRADN